MELVKEVEDYLLDFFEGDLPGQLMVAVSGGKDSMVLLDLLARLRERHGFVLYALHFNHQLQENAQDGELVVRSYCEKNKIKFVAASLLDSQKLYETRRGLEAEARAARYHFFGQAAEKIGGRELFLGHHRNDQIETVLLNIGRGSGLAGLEGMSMTSTTRHGLRVHRPLLNVSRRAIEQYCSARDIEYVDDPTNKDTNYARNCLRHEILPTWEKAQPAPEKAIFRLSRQAGLENDFWQDYVRNNFDFVVEKNEVRIGVESYRCQKEAARRRLLYFLIKKINSSIQGFSSKNIEQIDDLFWRGSGRNLSLPGKLAALKEYDRVVIFKKLKSLSAVELEFPEVADWGRGKIKIGGLHPDNAGIHYISYLNYSIPEKFTVRCWQAGDRLGGETGKKVKEIFEDNRIPFRARRRWPVLVAGDSVFCLPGLTDASEIERANTVLIDFYSEEDCFYDK